MFGGKKPRGFTIVETLIFLGVSGILFASVVILIEQKQANTYFFQGSRNFFSQMQDISNSVETGYYDNAKDFHCTTQPFPNTSAPIITTGGTANQGSNYGCTFVGYVMQFNPTNQPSSNLKYDVYAVFARQYAVGSLTTPPTNFQTALPRAELVGTVIVPPRLTVSSVNYTDGGNTVPDGLVGFFSNFANSTGSGSGSLGTQLIPIPTSQQFVDETTAQSYINNMSNTAATVSTSIANTSVTPINPSGGIDICLQSQDDKTMYTKVTIGGNGSGQSGNPLSVQTSTYQGANPCV